LGRKVPFSLIHCLATITTVITNPLKKRGERPNLLPAIARGGHREEVITGNFQAVDDVLDSMLCLRVLRIPTTTIEERRPE